MQSSEQELYICDESLTDDSSSNDNEHVKLRCLIYIIGSFVVYAFFKRSTFYYGNKGLPVFEWNYSMHTYKVDEIAQALLNDTSDKPNTCHRVPTNIEHNCSFIVDRSKLKSPADIKADDCGSW